MTSLNNAYNTYLQAKTWLAGAQAASVAGVPLSDRFHVIEIVWKAADILPESVCVRVFVCVCVREREREERRQNETGNSRADT